MRITSVNEQLGDDPTMLLMQRFLTESVESLYSMHPQYLTDDNCHGFGSTCGISDPREQVTDQDTQS